MAIQDYKNYMFKLLVYGTLFCQMTMTEATITWILPPPQRGPLLTSDSSVRTTIQQVRNGSSEAHLTWNFTLAGEILDRVIFQKGLVRIGRKTSSGIVSIDPTENFREHFDISRSDPATLIIYNATEADEALFSCKVETDIKEWTDSIQVQLVVETSFTSSPSGDQTVNEGSDLTLFCNTTGKPTPNVTWTRVLLNGTDGEVVFFGNSWIIVNINRNATGTYRCTAYNGIGNSVNHSLYINVTYQPDMVTLVTNTTENKDCSDLWVNFTCISSEANPPVYNYLLSDDEDEFSLSESGRWIKRISREGKSIYNCLAFQLVENVTSARNITLTVNVPASVRQVENKNVIEGDNVEEYCIATAGKPDPIEMWTNVTSGEHIEGNPLNITNINRAQAGDYKCTANNTCGDVSTLMNINVQYPPDMVTLVTNTTENKDCSDLWVNFTCISSEANPPVYNYLLSDDEDGFSLSESGMWVKKISREGKSIYNCLAFQLVENVTSARNITLTVNVPASVQQVEDKNVIEGDNVEEYCKVTAGSPDPIEMWTNVTSGEHIEGNPLNITNINRAQAGDYKCTANNMCGEVSTVMNINVQYGPEHVILTTNATSKVCTGVVINFTCTAEANPPVHTYLLYENDTMIKNMGISGTWIKTMENMGHFVFRCEANNSIQGIGKSGNTTLTVDVPASVEPAEKNIDVTENENVEVNCIVAAGIPDPTLLWTNVTAGKPIEGNPLNITNINRAQAGEYKCTANNTCGVDSTVVDINVQYQPGNVHLFTNATSKVCTGVVINFTCTAEANPQVHTYLLYENDAMIKNMGISGTWIKTMENAGDFVFRCEANNSIQGIGKSGNTTLTVDVPPSVEQAENRVVKEGYSVELHCIVTAGSPDPTLLWTNVAAGEHMEGNPLNITNIYRAQAGEYRCTANNTCGVDSTVVDIDVQYPPEDTGKNHTMVVSEGDPASIYCPVLGNPHPNITWYKGNVTSPSTLINATNILEFPETTLDNDGSYTCFAKNFLGNVTVTVQLLVEKPVSSTSSTSSKPTTKVVESTIFATATIDTSCDEQLVVKDRFPSVACERCRDLGCISAQAVDSRCSNVIIVDFEMKFNQSVSVSEVLNVLKTAAKQGNFDGFKVDPNSIEQTSTPTTGTSSTKKPVCSGFFEKDDCSLNLVLVIVIAVAGLIVICIIVGIIAWWVHKRRKCRKDTRVHHSTSEERPFSRENSTPGDDNSCSQVNNGYAEAGPQSAEMTSLAKHQEASGPATVPDYAVVDKSAKKGKKKDKKVEEQKLAAEPPQYAAVDKSKKKKKGEPDSTYAQVDMSKKSKKKPKPGEVLYADLGDFQQMQELPAVSTSPQALPPIKKPAPYGETQYADITQFLKGDATLPESNNSQGPGTGTQAAPAPGNGNSQEPGTSTKETSQASNPGGGGGPGHETNF